MRDLVLSIAIAAAVLIGRGGAFGRTAACPCNPCTCAPCTCGGGTSNTPTSHPTKTRSAKSEPGKTATNKTETRGHETKREKEHGHDHGHGHAEVGVSANIDLGGIGHRRAEPDPFAVPNEPVRTAQTQEKIDKPKRKPKEPAVTKSDPFANVHLTGEQAKDAAAVSTSAVTTESKP